jgi:hypothetical protein
MILTNPFQENGGENRGFCPLSPLAPQVDWIVSFVLRSTVNQPRQFLNFTIQFALTEIYDRLAKWLKW